mmetsp:Transcript_81784/g.253795  ORF Transcript_81784/g.253795 Transcript_81784/m.253795 type:complete len:228 (+) Transcript_81784:1660-2343(+)
MHNCVADRETGMRKRRQRFDKRWLPQCGLDLVQAYLRGKRHQVGELPSWKRDDRLVVLLRLRHNAQPIRARTQHVGGELVPQAVQQSGNVDLHFRRARPDQCLGQHVGVDKGLHCLQAIADTLKHVLNLPWRERNRRREIWALYLNDVRQLLCGFCNLAGRLPLPSKSALTRELQEPRVDSIASATPLAMCITQRTRGRPAQRIYWLLNAPAELAARKARDLPYGTA